MSLEIELKAWIRDAESVHAHLSELGTIGRSYRKEDHYFTHTSLPSSDPGSTWIFFRLRYDGGVSAVTYKEREIIAGIEQNREIEFTVSDPDSFIAFARALGFSELIVKRKYGTQYTVQGTYTILAEVSFVENLGDFLELEVLLPDDSLPDEILRARNELSDLFDRLGIDSDKIEPRRYTEMLMENR
jgi:predicted adenylyl cyclase CyaB